MKFSDRNYRRALSEQLGELVREMSRLADLLKLEDERLLSIAEVMDFTGIQSRASIYRAVDNGVLPRPVKIGGRTLWLKSEIVEKTRR